MNDLNQLVKDGIQAADQVLGKWTSGDLAEAVRNLSLWRDEAVKQLTPVEEPAEVPPLLATVDVRSLVNINVCGLYANVRTVALEAEPLYRKLRTVTLKKEKGKFWVYWTWEPQSNDPALGGLRDCGFSGHKDEGHPILIQIEVQPK